MISQSFVREELRANGADNMGFGNLQPIFVNAASHDGVKPVLVVETLIKRVSHRANDDDAPIAAGSFIHQVDLHVEEGAHEVAAAELENAGPRTRSVKQEASS